VNYILTRGLSLSGNPESMNIALGNPRNFLFIFLVALYFSFLLTVGEQAVLSNNVVKLGAIFQDLAILFFSVACFLFLKWFLVKGFARLYAVPSFADIQSFHFQNYIFLLSTSSLILICIMALLPISMKVDPSLLKTMIILSQLFFIVWIVLKVSRSFSLRKITIISYLCITELIPALLVLSWFLK
ncbi:MAG: DUF4271 domain-containing protein, partial [Bacteroidota bacterium]